MKPDTQRTRKPLTTLRLIESLQGSFKAEGSDLIAGFAVNVPGVTRAGFRLSRVFFYDGYGFRV